ncbi:MAG: glycosyltransferase family 4 protein [Paracoccaceae bacterium]
MAGPAGRLVIVLKGYPRLSETFIAQEILGLERAGLDIALVSLRHPTDRKRHPVHDEIRAPVTYLPEYLYREPWRALRGLAHAARRPGFGRAFHRFLRDLRRDPSPNRVRRFGQAAVLVREMPAGADWLYAHFIHTPASVAAYAALLTGLPWSVSAHAKDIWTAPDWDLSEKLGEMRWAVTCTGTGRDRLAGLSGGKAPVHLVYHGLDLARFGPPGGDRAPRDGSDPGDPVRIMSVGRAVEKKGFGTLIEALGRLPKGLAWSFTHVGGGDVATLRARAGALGMGDRVVWRGALDQPEVLRIYRAADVFALACRVAGDGDRDGLPNVLVEASSQGLACVSTRVSAIPELIRDGENGLLVPPDDPGALAGALARLIGDPALRSALGRAAEARVRSEFDHEAGLRRLLALFRESRMP